MIIAACALGWIVIGLASGIVIGKMIKYGSLRDY